jgi:hypothetical protein
LTAQSTNVALKEWAVTSAALAQGDQIFILRKGGIREDGRHFKIEHDRFLLYPGLFHEGEILLKADQRHRLELTSGDDYSREIPLTVYCELVETHDISEESDVTALHDLHIWSEDFPVKRFNWKPRHPLKLMVLRAYSLPATHLAKVEDSYGGCKSWVDLEDNVDLSTLQPALSDDQFATELDKLHKALNLSPATV